MACPRFSRPWRLQGDVNGNSDEAAVRRGPRETVADLWVEGKGSKLDREIRDRFC